MCPVTEGCGFGPEVGTASNGRASSSAVGTEAVVVVIEVVVLVFRGRRIRLAAVVAGKWGKRRENEYEFDFLKAT